MTAAYPSTQHPAQADKAPAAAARHTIFLRRQQLFGLGIDLVREVLPGQPLTRVPASKEQILGVLNLRGEVLPVVMIDGWLGLSPVADDPNLPILVLRRADLLVGLRVDAIQSVVSIPAHEIQPHPSTLHSSLLTSLWHPEGQAAVTLISGPALLEALCRQTSANTSIDITHP
jgi:chemotaxis signal transduction protein